MELHWYGDRIIRDMDNAGKRAIYKAGVLLAGYVRANKLSKQVIIVRTGR